MRIQYRLVRHRSSNFLGTIGEKSPAIPVAADAVEQVLDCEIALHEDRWREASHGPGQLGGKLLAEKTRIRVSDGSEQIEQRGLLNESRQPIFHIGKPTEIRFPRLMLATISGSARVVSVLEDTKAADYLADIILVCSEDGAIDSLEILGKNGASEVFSFSGEHGGLGCGEQTYDEQGRLGREVTDVEFAKIGDAWFPASAVERFYLLDSGEIAMEERIGNVTVERDSEKFPEDLFELQIPSDAAVLNTDTGQWRRDPEAVAQEIRRVTRQTPLRLWLVVINGCALAALGVYLYRRTRKA